MTKSTGKGRGGHRPGSGPKPDPSNRKEPFATRLPPEVLEWLRSRKAADPKFSMNAWIGAALKAAIDRITAREEAP